MNNDDATSWLEEIENLLSLLRERCMEANIQPTHTHDNHPASNIRQQDDYTGRRPFIHLDMANIHGLLQIRYTWQEIADLVGVSTKTLQHRLAVELAMTLNEDEIEYDSWLLNFHLLAKGYYRVHLEQMASQ